MSNETYSIYTGQLKMTENFNRPDAEKVCFGVRCDSVYAEKLDALYAVRNTAGDGSEFEKAKNLLLWLSEHVRHDGNYDNHIPCEPIELLKHAYDSGKERAVNCFALSVMLTGCCISVGLAARMVLMFPMSPYDFDNHVVTEVYLHDRGSWMMLDPTYGCYCTDAQGQLLGLWKLRETLAAQRGVEFNAELRYNDGEKPDPFDILTYYAKDLFYFTAPEYSCNAPGEQSRWISIAPAGFDVKKHSIENIRYRIAKNGDSEGMRNWLKQTEQSHTVYTEIDSFRAPPVTL